ncbi:hypothetical protein ACI48J_26240 [Paenibacillus chitinolyticus]|uniref:hypothetical protein n=1 Tax=Paenibacillus chitinolyticus TaxID=79263 RepID=UPI003867F286
MIKNRIFLVGICSTVIIGTIGLGLSNSSQADGANKKEQLENLKKEEQRLKAKLESNQHSLQSESTYEKSEREQDEIKLKKVGIEAGTLQNEIYPPDPRAKLEENIKSLKGVMETKSYYETLKNDPKHGNEYAKAAVILQQKKKTLAEIELNFKEGKKSIEQLTNDFKELEAIQELNNR